MAARISFLLATRNRAARLARCLEAVLSIDYADWELIVVDNGSTDSTLDVIRTFQTRFSGRLRSVSEPYRGLARARNTGILASSGDILAFSDDDCYPQADYLRSIETAFATQPDISYLSGRIELFDPADAPETIRTSRRPAIYPPRRYIGSGKVMGANMAFRRSVFEAAGLFDPLFGAGTSLASAEDQDMAIRASIAGLSGMYCPDAVVYHHHGRSPAEAAALRSGYNIGRGGLNMKLLLSRNTVRYGALGWLSLGKRVIRRQSTIQDEITGAVRYLRALRQAAADNAPLRT